MRSNSIILSVILMTLLVSCDTEEKNSILLLNHTGYHAEGLKHVVLQSNSKVTPENYEIINESGEVVFTDKFLPGGKIDNWHTGKAYRATFAEFNTQGIYKIRAKIGSEIVKSRAFTIDSNSLAQKSLSMLLDGFESQHVSGEFNKKDSQMSFFGERNDIVDVKGGWYDASGEKGKYLSHLCYSNFMNPQQTPMFVWNLLESIKQFDQNNNDLNKELRTRLLSEAAFGSDFLVRMQDPSGYFYLTVFANWSSDPTKREISAYETQDGIKTTDYQAGFREGGGISVAALARAANENIYGEFSSEKYLEVAEKGFEHLIENNVKYIDDGMENIIDDYCALMAATELFAVTNKIDYLDHARMRMTELTNRLSKNDNYSNWWSANNDGSRPFFHGSDAGLPIIALTRFLEFETEDTYRNVAIAAIKNSVEYEIYITKEVNNPFLYPRQYVKAINEVNNRSAFFLPHQNETGYWWQGENSRLASLSSAFYMAQQFLTKEQQLQTLEFASNNIDWIFGLNPYDACMVAGIGFNNPEYLEPVNLNFRGGVSNGITAGFTDETDIAFMPLPQNDDSSQRWRWSEQWMPHASWLILALLSAQQSM